MVQRWGEVRVRSFSWLIGVALWVQGCGGAVCEGDVDGDGLCGVDDPCPDDPVNDGDGDGICAGEDACLRGPDELDADLDGLPDACDYCPGDALNDGDGDGICDEDDACVADPENLCARSVTLALQVDWYFEESTWQLREDGGALVAEGRFDAPGDGVYQPFTLSPGQSRACVTLNDTYGDGGVRGMLWDNLLGVELTRWETASWETEGRFCADLVGGAQQAGSLPADEWSVGLARCPIRVEVQAGGWVEEMGWEITDARGRRVAGVAPGTWTEPDTQVADTVEVDQGEWTFWAVDSEADGWTDSSFRVLQGEVELIAGGLEAGERQGYPLSLRCP